ncbi:MAG: FAD-dependent monooxygenase [Arcanobacterium sp.]|nr:FAD-dependent monooxygenase [Arcanobacterium sp.]MDY5588860.1 FAD-dependent monooxygenase [Arcanobacterium sp.]
MAERTHAKVIIAGGGIAGVTATLMLAKQGIDSILLETAPAFQEEGAGLQLGPNVNRNLDEVGVLEKIRPLSVNPRRMIFRQGITGEVLTVVDLRDAERRYGGPYLVIHRKELLDKLVETAREQPDLISLQLNSEVVEHKDMGDSVLVRTADGREYTGEVLIGADGIHSRIRRADFVNDERVESGYVAFRGAIPIADMPEAGRSAIDDLVGWIGPNFHFVQYALHGGEMYNQVGVFKSYEFFEGHRQHHYGNLNEMAVRFQNAYPQIKAALPALKIVRNWPMADLEKLDHYNHGRVVLIGDAAHAVLQYLAQGAGQSMIDGKNLAEHLGAIEGEWSTAKVHAALQGYNDDRCEACGHVQDVCRMWGEIWHQDSPIGILIRDELFKSRPTYDYHYADWLWGPVVDPTPKVATEAELEQLYTV